MAPLIYNLVQIAANHIEFLSPLAGKEFRRYLTRCMMVIAIIGLFPLFKSFGMKNLKELGLPSVKENKHRFLYGFLFGFITLLIPVILAYGFGAIKINSAKGSSEIVKHLFNAIISAIVVGVIEETLFRGGILGAIKKIYGWTTAILISSAIYSIVHFFSRVESPSSVQWYSGFVTLVMMLRGFIEFNTLVPGFFNLFMVGTILGLFYKLTGNIYFSIGTHAGWVFWLKTYKFFAVFNPDANQWFFGSSKLIDGWIVFFILLLSFISILKAKKLNLKVFDVQD
ncbi:MAG TPA: CPBP family intramembrane metalloprotease [Verrucomicrobiota bacterium]|nr:CPBP family intramembrane metalloprotease [Verrucomicrobiota bacterium]